MSFIVTASPGSSQLVAACTVRPGKTDGGCSPGRPVRAAPTCAIRHPTRSSWFVLLPYSHSGHHAPVDTVYRSGSDENPLRPWFRPSRPSVRFRATTTCGTDGTVIPSTCRRVRRGTTTRRRRPRPMAPSGMGCGDQSRIHPEHRESARHPAATQRVGHARRHGSDRFPGAPDEGRPCRSLGRSRCAPTGG